MSLSVIFLALAIGYVLGSLFPSPKLRASSWLRYALKQKNRLGKDANDAPIMQQQSSILTRQQVEQTLPPTSWQHASYTAFKSTILSTNPFPFPCIYATKGFKSKEHRYIFLTDSTSPSNIKYLATALREYLSTPNLGPNTSLVVLFPFPSQLHTVEYYHSTYWTLLSSLHISDKQAWPKDVPKELDTPLWRFCFDGKPVFSAALTPAHVKRRSRYAGCFTVVFQPKSVFDTLFSSEVKKLGAIEKVRGLLRDYDDVEMSPELKNYGDPSGRESRQYFIMDENYSVPIGFGRLGEGV